MSDPLEDHLSCRHGRPSWRCEERVVPGKCFCEKHQLYLSEGSVGQETWNCGRTREESGNEDVSVVAANGDDGAGAGVGSAVAIGEENARLFGEVSVCGVNFAGQSTQLACGGQWSHIHGGWFGNTACADGDEFGDSRCKYTANCVGWGSNCSGNVSPLSKNGKNCYEINGGGSYIPERASFMGDCGKAGAGVSSVRIEVPFGEVGFDSDSSGGFLSLLCGNGGLGFGPSFNGEFCFGNPGFTYGEIATTNGGQIVGSGGIQANDGDHKIEVEKVKPGFKNKNERISMEDNSDVRQSQLVGGAEGTHSDYEDRKVGLSQVLELKGQRGQPKGLKDKKRPAGVEKGGVQGEYVK